MRQSQTLMNGTVYQPNLRMSLDEHSGYISEEVYSAAM
jgi:hypothetical protein